MQTASRRRDGRTRFPSRSPCVRRSRVPCRRRSASAGRSRAPARAAAWRRRPSSPVLVAPAVLGLLRDLDLLRRLGDRLPCTEQPLHLPPLPYDLLRRVPASFHRDVLLHPLAWAQGLSSTVVPFQGVRSRARPRPRRPWGPQPRRLRLHPLRRRRPLPCRLQRGSGRRARGHRGRVLAARAQLAASRFAVIARSMQERGHKPLAVAHFLNRVLFCLSGEDVGPDRTPGRRSLTSYAVWGRLRQRTGPASAEPA